MRQLVCFALFFAFVVLLGPVGLAQSTSPSPTPSASPASAQSPLEIARGRLDTMLRTGQADPAWFSASFLSQVSAAQVDQVIAGLIGSLGAYQSLEFAPTRFIAHFAKGLDDVQIHLDSDDKIDGLVFKPPAIAGATIDDALRALQRMRGIVSYVIVEEGRSERAALNASSSLAVGSAFKLAVLDALQDQVRNGSRHWTDVVPLDNQWKSLPSGVLRTWPDNTPLTLATYAAEMISISDNTAADALVHLTEGKALDRYAGGNRPFLTTREMFILKSTLGASLRSAYEAATTLQKRSAVLRRVDALPLPMPPQLLTTPDVSVEWHYSVRDLCDLIRHVASLPLMSINPGVADPAEFRHIAFKGGSDNGVINLTTMVTTRLGRAVCFSATVNDAERAVDEPAFGEAYAQVLRYVADF
jgi:hypothetical protein